MNTTYHGLYCCWCQTPNQILASIYLFPTNIFAYWRTWNNNIEFLMCDHINWKWQWWIQKLMKVNPDLCQNLGLFTIVVNVTLPTQSWRCLLNMSKTALTTNQFVFPATASSPTLPTWDTIWENTTSRLGRWFVMNVGRSPPQRTSTTLTGAMFTRWTKVSCCILTTYD